MEEARAVPGIERLNPFFIRDGVNTFKKSFEAGLDRGLNPFFIRDGVNTSSKTPSRRKYQVSIPSLSGTVSTLCLNNPLIVNRKKCRFLPTLYYSCNKHRRSANFYPKIL